MLKRTKIVATIGPASDSPPAMARLMDLGVDVFRFNMKHNTVSWHEDRIRQADRIAKKLGRTLGILIDLQGPEIRLQTRDKQPVSVRKGQKVRFVKSLASAQDTLCLPHEIIFTVVKPGTQLLIDDGFQEFDIQAVQKDCLLAVPREDYTLLHAKGVNFPGLDIPLSSLIDADLQKLDMATRNKVDFIALSFCRNKSDIEILRSEMKPRGLSAQIIAKIESKQALDNFEEILDEADGIMVARGDLGIEIPIEQLAFWQKQLIYRCRLRRKPVIVATQMLQSMIDHPRPTRAEASDVANAVWDGADAVMLSGESAYGKYPFKTVELMAKMLQFNESRCFVPELAPHAQDSTQAIVAAGIDIINQQTHLTPKLILVFTQTGYSARAVSAYRASLPVVAVSNSQKTVEELSLSYGVKAVRADFPTGEYQHPRFYVDKLLQDGLVQPKDYILVIHGSHWATPHATNSLALIEA